MTNGVGRDAKREKYDQVLSRLGALSAETPDGIMSAVACEVFRAFEHFHWAGFYVVVGEGLLRLGPYEGGHGCLEITFDRGVCGKCAREQKVQRVGDVSKLDYHISCSAETKSEIVLPVLDSDSKLTAVFDIDSTELNAFDDVDEEYLTKIAGLLRG